MTLATSHHSLAKCESTDMGISTWVRDNHTSATVASGAAPSGRTTAKARSTGSGP
jgi:hypothetical protein